MLASVGPAKGILGGGGGFALIMWFISLFIIYIFFIFYLIQCNTLQQNTIK